MRSFLTEQLAEIESSKASEPNQAAKEFVKIR